MELYLIYSTTNIDKIAAGIAKEAIRLVRENTRNFTINMFKNFFLLMSNSIRINAEPPAVLQLPDPEPSGRPHGFVRESAISTSDSESTDLTVQTVTAAVTPASADSSLQLNNRTLAGAENGFFDFNVEQIDQMISLLS